MPRRRAHEAAQVLGLLERRGALDGWEVVPIQGRTEARSGRHPAQQPDLPELRRAGGLRAAGARGARLRMPRRGLRRVRRPRVLPAHRSRRAVEDGDVVGFAPRGRALIGRFDYEPDADARRRRDRRRASSASTTRPTPSGATSRRLRPAAGGHERAPAHRQRRRPVLPLRALPPGVRGQHPRPGGRRRPRARHRRRVAGRQRGGRPAARGRGPARRGSRARGQPGAHRHLQRGAARLGGRRLLRAHLRRRRAGARSARPRHRRARGAPRDRLRVRPLASTGPTPIRCRPRGRSRPGSPIWTGLEWLRDHVQARPHGRLLARGRRAHAAPAADRRLPAVAAAHRRRRDVDALRGPLRRRLHQGRRPGLLPAPRRADDDRARADRRPAPAQGRLRRPLRRRTPTASPAPTGCNGGRTARWPRRPCGARAGPTTGAGWTRRR